MIDESTPLPETVTECHVVIRQLLQVSAELQASNAKLEATIKAQAEGLESLKRDRDLLKRALFGRRRERFEDPDQQYLFPTLDWHATEEERDEPPRPQDLQEPTPGKRGGRVRRVIPECLPRVKRVQKLDEVDIPEHLRGQKLRRFEKKVGEWVEWQPPQLQVIEEYVETVAIDNADATGTELISAPREPRILPCLAGPSLLASLAVSRFADHQPYYRLEEILHRSGLLIDRATQCRWMIRLAEAASPLVMLMRKLALKSVVAQADETPVKMLVPGQGYASTAYLWAILGDQQQPYTTFYFTEDRSRAGPDQFFANFSGTLVADAYIAYELLSAESQGRIRLAGCHVHARRKFEALHQLGPTTRTSTAMGYFQRLLDLEDEWLSLADEERYEQRQRRAAPLLAEFKSWLDELAENLRPKDELRRAIAYMTKRWECFEHYLSSGAIPAHNNAAEQAVKLPVMGKKAWLFFGNTHGGQAAAVFFTLTATCRRLRIDPYAYLKDVFERLPRCQVDEPDALTPLLPDRWLADHPQARLQMRQEEAEHKAVRKRTRRAQRRKALDRQRPSN